MENKKPQIVSIDGTEYDANNFTEEQVTLFNHCADLERKIGSTAFQLQQLHVGKDAFIRLLKTALEAPAEKVIAEEVN
jgi:hypothetical protein